MTGLRFRFVWPVLCAAIPAALLLTSAPAMAKKKVKSVEVGPIWNQADAERKCRKVARKYDGTWTGQWRTTRPGKMSECDIKVERGQSGFTVNIGGRDKWDDDRGWKHGIKSVEVGPIWNQADANLKCPKAAREFGGTWTGDWRTTRPGQMSECDIKRY